MRGGAGGLREPNQHRFLIVAYRRQQLPIIEQRLRYVAILLAAFRWEMVCLYDSYLAE
jgi:hypothetical protein